MQKNRGGVIYEDDITMKKWLQELKDLSDDG